MTATKQIRAALVAATPGPWETHHGTAVKAFAAKNGVIGTMHSADDAQDRRNADLIANAPAWLAWCLEQIEKRDKLLTEYVHVCDECYEDEYDIETCPLCRRARKVMEESK